MSGPVLTVKLVGPRSCGKSTVAALLVSALEPYGIPVENRDEGPEGIRPVTGWALGKLLPCVRRNGTRVIVESVQTRPPLDIPEAFTCPVDFEMVDCPVCRGEKRIWSPGAGNAGQKVDCEACRAEGHLFRRRRP